jgi:hypothetical protein
MDSEGISDESFYTFADSSGFPVRSVKLKGRAQVRHIYRLTCIRHRNNLCRCRQKH